MIKTFIQSYSLKNTYRINSIIYAIKHLPIIGKFLPSELYGVGALKTVAGVLSAIWEFITMFLYKVIYIAIIAVSVTALYDKIPASNSFLHVFVFFTFVGTLLNTSIFNVEVHVYYAIKLLRMDAKNYALSNYLYFILRIVVGLYPVMFLCGLLIDMPLIVSLTLPLFVVASKICVTGVSIQYYRRTNKAANENKLSSFTVLASLVLFVAAMVPPFLGIVISENVYLVIFVAVLVMSVLALVSLFKFDNYTEMYKMLLLSTNSIISVQTSAQATQLIVENNRRYISNTKNVTSNKTGFDYLNELFIKRHRKLLWRPAIIISVAAAVLIVCAAVCIIVVNDKELLSKLNEAITQILPLFTLVMYLVNRGSGFTQALFMNCDHSMLTYSFYKKPQFILKLFAIRLREIIKINLLPAVVIAVGFVTLLIVTGGAGNPLYYIFIPLTLIAMSVFFSVHYLTIYYLLQPYNANTEIKSAMFQVINYATYILCFAAAKARPEPLIFAVIVSVFCILYCAVACILVYKFADKTFKLRL